MMLVACDEEGAPAAMLPDHVSARRLLGWRRVGAVGGLVAAVLLLVARPPGQAEVSQAVSLRAEQVQEDEVAACDGAHAQAGCLENGEDDAECCALAGEAGCKGGALAAYGSTCNPNGAVATCCPKAPSTPNLFCWMVVDGTSYEADVTRESWGQGRGIFACNTWSVMADGALDPLPVKNIGTLNSKMAPWGSYYNAEVFVRAWEAVIKDGQYLTADWVVKADPDTVWVPERLRKQLCGEDPTQRVIVRNAGKEYLGPLEVFSVAAAKDFASRHRGVCMYGVDVSGEDGWIEACMARLGVTSKTEEKLLKSDKSTRACSDKSFVAYHPFKRIDLQGTCYELLK